MPLNNRTKRHPLRFLTILLLLSTLTISSTHQKQPLLTKNGGKVAYRNYFLGNYYYNEAQIQKSVGYFRKAYQAANRPSFALAYALALAETGKANAGLDILAQTKNSLLPLHPEYEQQLTNFLYVDAIVRTRVKKYAAANVSLNRAIRRTQQKGLHKAQERLAGMYNLAAYLKIMSQEAYQTHGGLDAHAHVQLRELEAALPLYEKALSLDTSRLDSKQNLQTIADTLALEFEINPVEPPTLDYKRAGVYNVKDFPHLPDRIEGILPFGHYDELLFLVDISGSMVMENVGCIGADRFTVMKETAEYLLTFLPDSTLAGLATIGGDCEDEPDWWVATDSINRRDLQFQIKYLNPNGTTPLLTTLLQTPALFTPNSSSTKSIFFISDGENVCSLSDVDICDWANSLAEQNITLNVLTFLDQGLSNSGAFAEYACLADRSGGKVRYLDPISCSIDEAEFDLMDKVTFTLPHLERVNCWGAAVEKMWAIFEE